MRIELFITISLKKKLISRWLVCKKKYKQVHSKQCKARSEKKVSTTRLKKKKKMSSSSSKSQRSVINVSIAVAAAAAAATSYFLYKSFFSAPKSISGNNKEATIKNIWVYPIAGCKGFCLSKEGQGWNLVDGGLEFDREFCFVVPSSTTPPATATTTPSATTTTYKKLSTMAIQNEIFTDIVSVTDDGVPSSSPRRFLIVRYKNAPFPLKIPLEDQNQDQANSYRSSSPTLSFDLERYGTFGKAADCGDDAARWFREFVFGDLLLSKFASDADKESYKSNHLSQVRLVRVSQFRKPVTKASHEGSGATEADAVRFQAFGSLHLVTKESLSWLQSRLPDGTVESAVPGAAPSSSSCASSSSTSAPTKMIVTSERFRANLEVEGIDFPLEESWKRCEIVPSCIHCHSNVEESTNKNDNDKTAIPLHFAKHTDRCEVPAMNPVTGRRHPQMQPTSTIKNFHGARHPHQILKYNQLKKESEGQQHEPLVKAMFGIEMFHEKNGRICVGDKIIVKETGEGLIIV